MSKYQFTVEAQPQYLAEASDPGAQAYAFAYTITIRTVGEVAAQLISRHWDIEDASGLTEEVDGLGVVGHQPLLQPGESFRYSSSARLRTPMGIMSGHYFCVAVDGTRFEVAIAPFVLRADAADGAPRLH